MKDFDIRHVQFDDEETDSPRPIVLVDHYLANGALVAVNVARRNEPPHWVLGKVARGSNADVLRLTRLLG